MDSMLWIQSLPKQSTVTVRNDMVFIVEMHLVVRRVVPRSIQVHHVATHDGLVFEHVMEFGALVTLVFEFVGHFADTQPPEVLHCLRHDVCGQFKGEFS